MAIPIFVGKKEFGASVFSVRTIGLVLIPETSVVSVRTVVKYQCFEIRFDFALDFLEIFFGDFFLRVGLGSARKSVWPIIGFGKDSLVINVA